MRFPRRKRLKRGDEGQASLRLQNGSAILISGFWQCSEKRNSTRFKIRGPSLTMVSKLGLRDPRSLKSLHSHPPYKIRVSSSVSARDLFSNPAPALPRAGFFIPRLDERRRQAFRGLVFRGCLIVIQSRDTRAKTGTGVAAYQAQREHG